MRKKELVKIKREVKKLKTPPHLTIFLVGNNPRSEVYVRNKIKLASECGIKTNLVRLKETVSQNHLLRLIKKENENKKTTGLFVQFPLPSHMDEDIVANAISPKKDIDGLTQENLGKLVQGDKNALIPCTVSGVMQILSALKVNLVGQDIVIVGRSNIVGKPLAQMLINHGATVQVCNSKTKNLAKKTQNADIVVTAIGVPKFFTPRYFKKGQIVIDVGINKTKDGLCGDVDYTKVKPLVKYLTPVPGGVGVLTVVNVLKNIIKAAELK